MAQRRYYDDNTVNQRAQHYQHDVSGEKSMTLGRPSRLKRTQLFEDPQNLSAKGPPSVPSRTVSVRHPNLRANQATTHSSRVQLTPHTEQHTPQAHSEQNESSDSEIGTLEERKKQLLQNFPQATLKPAVRRKPDQDHNKQPAAETNQQYNSQQPSTLPKPSRTMPSTHQDRSHEHTPANARPSFKSSPSVASTKLPERNSSISSEGVMTRRPFPSNNSQVRNTADQLHPRMKLKAPLPQDGSTSSSESGSSGDGRFVRRKRGVQQPPPNSRHSQVSKLSSSLQLSGASLFQAPESGNDFNSGVVNSPSTYPPQQHQQRVVRPRGENEMNMSGESQAENAFDSSSMRMEGIRQKVGLRRTPSTRSISSVSGSMTPQRVPESVSERDTNTKQQFGSNSQVRGTHDQSSASAQQLPHNHTRGELRNSGSQNGRRESSGGMGASDSESMELQKFLSTSSHLLPARVNVRQGLVCGRHSISQNEQLNLLFIKLCRVAVVHDLEKSHHYVVPINSSQKFGVIYDPSNNQRSIGGYVFHTAGEIMKAKTGLPHVVLATSRFDGGSPEKSVEANELLFIRGVPKSTVGRARYLKVQTLDFNEKHLSSKCAGNFSTKPEDVQMHLSTMIDHSIPLPQKAILYPESQLKPLLPSSLVFDAIVLEKLTNIVTVVTTMHGGSNDNSLSEISTDLNLKIEQVPLSKSEHEQLHRVSHNMYSTFTSLYPFFVCGTHSTELQDILYHRPIPNMEMKGVQLYLPNVTAQPPELKDALQMRSVLSKDVFQSTATSEPIQPSTTDSSSGEETDDQSETSSYRQDAVSIHEDQHVPETQSHVSGGEIGEEEVDEDDLYETIEDAIEALPDDEAQRLKTAASEGVASMRSKITDMLKKTGRQSGNPVQERTTESSSPTPPYVDVQHNESTSFESDEEPYDNVSYNDIQEKSPPPPVADIKLKVPLPITTVSQPSIGASKKENQLESDKDEFQHPRNARSVLRPFKRDIPTSPPRLPPPLSSQPRDSNSSTVSFSQAEKKSMPPDENYKKLQEQYATLECQVAKLTDEMKQLKSTVDQLTFTSTDRQKGGSSTQGNMCPQTPQSAEDNQRFLATLDEHQVLMLLDEMKMSHYKPVFSEEMITGELLLECDEETLRNDLQVTSRLHRNKLLLLIHGRESARRYIRNYS